MTESDWIRKYIAPLVSAPGADGLRDDVAVLNTQGATIATMDTLVAGVHFLSSDPCGTIGQKLVRVNASDILAKGAEPAEALLSIAWPKGRPESDFGELVTGMAGDFQDFGIALIGGDLVGTDGPLTLTLTMTGACINKGPVRRSTGKPGHDLWVDGEIGWGRIGLEAARAGGDPQTALRYQVPRISTLFAAQIVADLASASMDISDGLLIDAGRLADASGCGVRIALESVPLARPTKTIAEILDQCSAGDDYRILLSAPSGQSVPGFFRIGTLTESGGLQLSFNGRSVNPPSRLGYEH